MRKLARPPIVEAVLDIDCDLPPGFDLVSQREAFAKAWPEYPSIRTRFQNQVHLTPQDGAPASGTIEGGVDGYLYSTGDGKQLLQARKLGYSFNRLSPYGSLDDYLGEIERRWGQFIKICGPTLVRGVRLRYINRIEVPGESGTSRLSEWVNLATVPPVFEALSTEGFFHQYALRDPHSSARSNVILASQPSAAGKAGILLDLTAYTECALMPGDWPGILGKIECIRGLKDGIFFGSLTEKCVALFE